MKLSDSARNKLVVVYHSIVVLVSLFMVFGCGLVSYQGIGNERATWILAFMTGVFGMILWLYLWSLGGWIVNKLRVK